jgi:hypothetical protein
MSSAAPEFTQWVPPVHPDVTLLPRARRLDLLGERLDAEVLTADSGWGTTGRIRQIR